MKKKMWTLELFGPGGCNDVIQVDREIKGDPLSDCSDVKDVISHLLWSHGASFQPVEGEPSYEGWSRLVINIMPTETEEELYDPNEEES